MKKLVPLSLLLLLYFGYLKKIFINHCSQLEMITIKLTKITEDYLEVWKKNCISFISSPPNWCKHMHKEELSHIAIIDEESFKQSSISSYRYTPML